MRKFGIMLLDDEFTCVYTDTDWNDFEYFACSDSNGGRTTIGFDTLEKARAYIRARTFYKVPEEEITRHEELE